MQGHRPRDRGADRETEGHVPERRHAQAGDRAAELGPLPGIEAADRTANGAALAGAGTSAPLASRTAAAPIGAGCVAIAALAAGTGFTGTALAPVTGIGLRGRAGPTGRSVALGGATRAARSLGTATRRSTRLGAARTAFGTARPAHRAAVRAAGTAPHPAASAAASAAATGRTGARAGSSTGAAGSAAAGAAPAAWAALRECRCRSGHDDGRRNRVSQNALHGLSSCGRRTILDAHAGPQRASGRTVPSRGVVAMRPVTPARAVLG
ncbi:hypothetical protein [Methylobacterium sp. 391_Methyba4]|uniref:hypothetical protein n=1 Tax=Methylobacterium sp. 391_Methyba4 TaxID=3038924 RepID=UPI00325B496A